MSSPDHFSEDSEGDMVTSQNQEPQTYYSQIVTISQMAQSRMMSWILNSEEENKKEALIRSSQSLHHYVHKYFEITNELSKILNTLMEEHNFDAVLPNENESVEQNCARVRKVMHQILGVCESEDKKCLKLAPALYEKIAFSVTSLKEKAKVIKELHESSKGLLGNVFCPLVTIQIAKCNLESVMPPVEQLTSLSSPPFVLGDLEQSSKVITRRLCGPQKKQKALDEAVPLVQDFLSVLRTPCDSYYSILCRVEAYVTIISEKI